MDGENESGILYGDHCAEASSGLYNFLTMSISPDLNSGESVHWPIDSHRCLYFSGTCFSDMRTGNMSQRPVILWRSGLSVAMCVDVTDKFAPAEMPPTMKPAAGSAPRLSALSATHSRQSRISLLAVGNGCSGASRYEGATTVALYVAATARASGASWSVLPRMKPPP